MDKWLTSWSLLQTMSSLESMHHHIDPRINTASHRAGLFIMWRSVRYPQDYVQHAQQTQSSYIQCTAIHRNTATASSSRETAQGTVWGHKARRPPTRASKSKTGNTHPTKEWLVSCKPSAVRSPDLLPHSARSHHPMVGISVFDGGGRGNEDIALLLSKLHALRLLRQLIIHRWSIRSITQCDTINAFCNKSVQWTGTDDSSDDS